MKETIRIKFSMVVKYPYVDSDYGYGVGRYQTLRHEKDFLVKNPPLFLNSIKRLEDSKIEVDNVIIYTYNSNCEVANGLEDDWTPIDAPVIHSNKDLEIFF